MVTNTALGWGEIFIHVEVFLSGFFTSYFFLFQLLFVECMLDTVQDFLNILGMKLCIHIAEISIRQTYKNYDGSRQKLGTFLENKVF